MNKNENFICGKYAVISAIENQYRKKYHLFYSKQNQELIDSFRNKINFKTSLVDAGKLNFLSKGLKHQGLLLQCEKYIKGGIDNYLDKIASSAKADRYDLDRSELERNEMIIILDHPADSRNVGSVIRSMYLNGFSSIFVPKNASCSQDASMALAASGAIDIIDYYQVINVNKVMQKLKENDFWIFGLSINGQNLHDYQDKLSKLKKIALVIGKESSGLSPLVEKNCDFLVSLAMKNITASSKQSITVKKNNFSNYLPDSYNLSIAASIAIYDICRYNLNLKGDKLDEK